MILWNMIRFARRNSLILQFIELELPREDKFYTKYPSDMTKIESQLRMKTEKVLVRSIHHRRKYYLLGSVEAEVVRSMLNTEFCWIPRVSYRA